MPNSSARYLIGVVPNLVFLSDEELWLALTTAQLEETVRSMSDGLDSLIGNRGVRLSGGQQQRLAIARILLTKPSMLILDEATSALDEETERILHKSLSKHFKNMTVLIIAHRHSALAQADKIYTMEEGILYETEPQSLKQVSYSTAATIAK